MQLFGHYKDFIKTQEKMSPKGKRKSYSSKFGPVSTKSSFGHCSAYAANETNGAVYTIIKGRRY